MYTGLLHIHSLLRWLILLMLVITISKAFAGWLRKKQYTALDNKLSLFTMIATHIQLLAGIVLYVMSEEVREGWQNFGAAMKEPMLRFWAVEHITGMLLAVALITIGRMSVRKKAHPYYAVHLKVALYFLFALLIILYFIPWPWSEVSRGFYMEHVTSHF